MINHTFVYYFLFNNKMCMYEENGTRFTYHGRYIFFLHNIQSYLFEYYKKNYKLQHNCCN